MLHRQEVAGSNPASPTISGDGAAQLDASVRALSELQTLDQEIGELRGRLTKIPHGVEKLRVHIDELRAGIKTLSERLEEIRKARRAQEVELEVKAEAAKKYETQLAIVKTNKEYSALLHEQAEQKEACARIEENVLAFMEETEQVEKLIGDRTGGLQKEEQELDRKGAEAREQQSEVQKQLEQREVWRVDKAAVIETSLMERYERVRKGRGGSVLVPVKDGCCQGCFMELRAQVMSELMGATRLVTCERCSRLLFMETSGER